MTDLVLGDLSDRIEELEIEVIEKTRALGIAQSDLLITTVRRSILHQQYRQVFKANDPGKKRLES